LEYFDDKSDVYSTNRAEILHAVIFWEDLQFQTLKRPKTKKHLKTNKGKKEKAGTSTSKKCDYYTGFYRVFLALFTGVL